MAASVGMRVLIGVVLSVVTGLGVGVASGSAGGDALQPAPPAAELRVELQNATFGTQTYTLTCSPAGGTMPNPPAVCSAIAAELALLVNPGELPLACTEATAVHVSGTYNDTPVDAEFTPSCPDPTSRDRLLGRWFSFLPHESSVVRVDQGVGPLSLGESRAAVLSIFGNGKEGRRGVRVYRGVQRVVGHSVASIYAVGYDGAGRVDTLISIAGALQIYDRVVERADPEAPEPERNPVLARWLRVRCAGVKARAVRPLAHAPTTVIGPVVGRYSFEEQAVVVVSDAPRSACAVAGYLRTHDL